MRSPEVRYLVNSNNKMAEDGYRSWHKYIVSFVT